MVRRKHRKRPRQKTKFQKTFRKNAGSKNRDEESDTFVQRSPEAVLYESPHADLLCNEKLSPEIIPKRSRIRLLRAKACDDDAEVEDEIAARTIELSNSSSLKRHESDSKCNYKHDVKSTNDFPHLEDYPKRDIGGSVVGETFDSADCYSLRSLFLKKEQSSDKSTDDAPKNISQSATFCSNLESRLLNNIYIFTGGVPEHVNSDKKSGGRSPEKRSQPETTNDCYSLNKTLWINDDLVCNQNNYLEKQPSAIIASHFTVKKSSSIADLQSESLDKFILARSSLCETVERNDGLRDKADKSKKRRSDNDKRFDAETFGERLIANWHEQLGKIFSYLWRMTKKIGDQKTSLLAKYKKFIDDRWRSCTSTTTLSSVTTFFAPAPLPSDTNNENPITYRSLLAKEDRESEKSDLETENIEYEIQSGSTTPCSGSPPPAKRCRTILTFEDEKAEERRQPASRAEIADPFFKKERRSVGRSFPLNLPSCEQTSHWNVSESTYFLSDPSAVSDYDDCENALQQKRYRDDDYKHDKSRNTATTRNSRNRSRRRSVPRAIITWMIALCMWLKRKLLHLLNSAYKKIQMINSFLTKKSPRTKNISKEERTNYLVTTLHFENEKTLCELSRKMTRLSADLVQMRTNIETEINVICGANKKMAENNATIMQELKKLHEILEKMQSKSPQSIPLSSSFPSYPPPPPPPPLPLSVLPSTLTFPLKTQSSTLTTSPPRPSLSSASVQSSMSSTQPTTPDNSNESNKISTPTSKCVTPSSNRPRITVEDLLKVTLKKAPQSAKENRRNFIQGPAVSLEMLRNVKLKSTKRRSCDQTGRSPRSRIMKNRTASNINLSPILTGSEQNLERILRQVKLTRPRRLIIESSSFQDDFMKETQSLETLTRSQSQSRFDQF